VKTEIAGKIDKKLARSSNFEWLRVISILLIIAYHYCIHGNEGEIFKSDIYSNQLIAIIFGSWGLLGVNSFIFISAYFSIDSSKFSSKKLIKIILQTIFYSTSIAFLLYFIGAVEFSLMGLTTSLFSPFFGTYWFVTAYCMLYIIFPFLNKIIYSMESRYLLKLLIILTIFIPIYSTIWINSAIGYFIFAVYLYLLMGYLKRNPQNWFEVYAKKGFWITCIAVVLFNTSVSFLGTLLNLEKLSNYVISQVIGLYSPAMVLAAIFLFYIFKNISITSSKLVNALAKTTLGIYLFHENPILRKILWDDILNIDTVYYSPIFILYFFISTLILLVIGALIDMLRIVLLEKPFFSIIYNFTEIHFKKVDSWINEDSPITIPELREQVTTRNTSRL
jgi:surface polysaccharide O-acyltransferase-like enzyme